METTPDIVVVLIVTIIVSAIPFMVLSAIRSLIDIIREESDQWRRAYLAVHQAKLEVTKKYGSTITNNNSESSSGPVEKQPDLEQSDNSVVESSEQPENYAHLVSNPAETVVSFGEDVED